MLGQTIIACPVGFHFACPVWAPDLSGETLPVPSKTLYSLPSLSRHEGSVRHEGSRHCLSRQSAEYGQTLPVLSEHCPGKHCLSRQSERGKDCVSRVGAWQGVFVR